MNHTEQVQQPDRQTDTSTVASSRTID